MNSSSIDMHALARQAMTLYGFQPFFPSGVMEEVQALKASSLNFQNEIVKDLRSVQRYLPGGGHQ